MGYILTVLWFVFGIVGYLMMRQGFLAKYEECLGKKMAWGTFEILLGIMLALYGPIAIIVSIVIHGKYCFKKRKTK